MKTKTTNPRAMARTTWVTANTTALAEGVLRRRIQLRSYWSGAPIGTSEKAMAVVTLKLTCCRRCHRRSNNCGCCVTREAANTNTDERREMRGQRGCCGDAIDDIIVHRDACLRPYSTVNVVPEVKERHGSKPRWISTTGHGAQKLHDRPPGLYR